jgi:hypothetical protein
VRATPDGCDPGRLQIVPDFLHSTTFLLILVQVTHMILEVIFWIAFIAVSQAIAGIYYRRRDLRYGPHRSRRSKAGNWGRQNSINGIPRTGGGWNI